MRPPTLLLLLLLLSSQTSGPLSIQWSTYIGAFTSTLEVFTAINSQHTLSSMDASTNYRGAVVLLHSVIMCMSWVLHGLITAMIMTQYLGDLRALNSTASERVLVLKQVWKTAKSSFRKSARICLDKLGVCGAQRGFVTPRY
jgi:hypothetical protein